MVTEFGMTVTQGPGDSAPLAQPTSDYALSDRTRREVDQDAQELAQMAYARARQLMELNRRTLDDLAAAALEHETLTREDLDDIFDAHELRRTLLPETEADEADPVSEALDEGRRFSPGATPLVPQRSVDPDAPDLGPEEQR
jgi:cell division protease FtsH